MAIDPVCGMQIDEATAEEMGAETAEYKGKTYYFCCPFCREQFERDPEKYLQQPGAHHDEIHGGHH